MLSLKMEPSRWCYSNRARLDCESSRVQTQIRSNEILFIWNFIISFPKHTA